MLSKHGFCNRIALRTNDVTFAQNVGQTFHHARDHRTALSEIRVLELLFLALVRSAIAADFWRRMISTYGPHPFD